MEILPQLIANSIIAGATYALFTLGFNLIFGAAKFVNMAHGVVGVSGAYVTLTLIEQAGFPSYLSVALGIAAAGFIGYLTYKAIFTPLRAKKSSSLILFLASLGLFSIVQALLAIIFSPSFQSFPSSGAPRIYEIAGASITGVQVAIICTFLVAFAGLAWMLKKTMFGKAVRAVSDDEEVAEVIGVDTKKILGKVFFIGSAIAGLAAIARGFDIGIQPTLGLLIFLEGAISSIIGGIGNIYGGVLGAFLLGFAENFGIWKISAEWKPAISFLLLIIFLVFRPRGIMKR